MKGLSVRDVRAHCLDCCRGSTKDVIWCPCDGVNSTTCHLWPYRLAKQPATFAAKYGDRLLTPGKMPPSDIELDLLPAGFEEAAMAEIDVDGYRQPTVTTTPDRSRNQSSEDREIMKERARKAREARRREERG